MKLLPTHRCAAVSGSKCWLLLNLAGSAVKGLTRSSHQSVRNMFACSAGQGGGLFVNGNGATFTNITATALLQNTAGWQNSSGDGGALYVDGGATWLANNTFSENSAPGRGGAVAYMHDCFQSPTVQGDEQAVVHPPLLPFRLHVPACICDLSFFASARCDSCLAGPQCAYHAWLHSKLGLAA